MTTSKSQALVLDGFGVAFGAKVVLSNIDLEVPAQGLVTLMGPVGNGKSTLVRTLAGFNAARPAHTTWGEARIGGSPWGPEARCALVHQKAQVMLSTVRDALVSALPNRSALMVPEQTDFIRQSLQENGMEDLLSSLEQDVVSLPLVDQRRLSILRALFSHPTLLALDEPCAALPLTDHGTILRFIAEQAERRGVLWITHNQANAKRMGTQTALLAGGIIQEVTATRVFFSEPTSKAGRAFVKNGSCDVPGPMAKAEELAPFKTLPPPIPLVAYVKMEAARGPRDFYWVEDSAAVTEGVLAPIRGHVGGLPRPGIVKDVEEDLRALSRLGIDVLITLEEEQTVPADALEEASILGVHFPIVDMKAPEMAPAVALIKRIHDLVERGMNVAVHCLAGLGRTGTILACWLVSNGRDPLSTVDSIRHSRPRSIQSREQVEFIKAFAVAYA